jgi:hypothetical protein
MHNDKRGASAPHFFAPDSVYLPIVYAVTALGMVCLLAGVALALYTAWVVFSLINDPNSVPWIGALVAKSEEYMQAVRGTVEGRAFSLELGREIFVAGQIYLAVLVLWAIGGLAKALIGAGISLLASLAPRDKQAPPAA